MDFDYIDLSSPNDGLGDSLRDGGVKINANFTKIKDSFDALEGYTTDAGVFKLTENSYRTWANSYWIGGVEFNPEPSFEDFVLTLPATDEKWVIFYGDDTGSLGFIEGTEDPSPVRPTLAANQIYIGEVLLSPSGSENLTETVIYDDAVGAEFSNDYTLNFDIASTTNPSEGTVHIETINGASVRRQQVFRANAAREEDNYIEFDVYIVNADPGAILNISLTVPGSTQITYQRTFYLGIDDPQALAINGFDTDLTGAYQTVRVPVQGESYETISFTSDGTSQIFLDNIKAIGGQEVVDTSGFANKDLSNVDPADVKTAYESNADTNPFTDDDKNKLDNEVVTSSTKATPSTAKKVSKMFYHESESDFDSEVKEDGEFHFWIDSAGVVKGSYGVQDSEGYDIILLVGQSNMVGRSGPIDPVLDATDAQILMYGKDNRTVVLAQDPLDHWDEISGDIGMGMSIAKAYIADGRLTGNRKVLLVPAADGGTGFAQGDWNDGDPQHENAITQVNEALALSGGTHQLVAICWHQGENDGGANRTKSQYSNDLDNLITIFRNEITGADNTTPFIVGDLIEGNTTGTKDQIRESLSELPTRVTYTAFTSSSGLVSNGDNLHFDASSLRTFGQRYFNNFTVAENNTGLNATAPDAVVDLVAKGNHKEAILEWSAPDANGSPITDYTIQYKESSSGTWLNFTDGTSSNTKAKVTGLTNNILYDFRIYAINAAGTSPASNVATTTPQTREFESAGHWLLGNDNTAMEDLISNQTLTPANSAPTHFSGYLRTPDSFLSGLITPIEYNSAQTLCAVVRQTDGEVKRVISGTLAGTNGGGGSVLFTDDSRSILSHRSPSAVVLDDSGEVPINQWIFIAMTYGLGNVLGFRGTGASYKTETVNGTLIPPDDGRNIALGNAYYSQVADYVNNGIDAAEFVVFDTKKTIEELNDIYIRTKVRMSERGITVV